MNDNFGLTQRIARLERALSALVAWLEDREDIDDNGNANDAMQLLIELKELGILAEKLETLP